MEGKEKENSDLEQRKMSVQNEGKKNELSEAESAGKKIIEFPSSNAEPLFTLEEKASLAKRKFYEIFGSQNLEVKIETKISSGEVCLDVIGNEELIKGLQGPGKIGYKGISHLIHFFVKQQVGYWKFQLLFNGKGYLIKELLREELQKEKEKEEKTIKEWCLEGLTKAGVAYGKGENADLLAKAKKLMEGINI